MNDRDVIPIWLTTQVLWPVGLAFGGGAIAWFATRNWSPRHRPPAEISGHPLGLEVPVERVTLHEAAHAVAAHVLGADVGEPEEVVSEPEGD